MTRTTAHTRAVKAVFGMCLLVLPSGFLTRPCHSGEPVMLGHTPARNFVSPETGLPQSFELDDQKNIKWTARLGTHSYGGPLVADSKVFVGTNNEKPRDAKHKGDRGNLMVFKESDGSFLWQSAHPKLKTGAVNDWPQQGVASTPVVEGKRVYYVSNRAEVICADTEGFRDKKNNGPYKGEKHTDLTDEDIIWKYDMIGELDVFPHNLAAGSPLIVGDLLYTVTGNGVDDSHKNLPAAEAPSFIALNKKTGKLVWSSALPGKNILHGTWSNPSYGVIQGKPQVLFPGGDAWLYAFEPLTGELIWKFNLNLDEAKWKHDGTGDKNSVLGNPTIHGGRVYIGVGQDPEHGVGAGRLWAIQPKGQGDLSGKAAIWQLSGKDFHRTLSSSAISDGLLYTADLAGFVYCIDLESGTVHWKYDAFASIWGSPLVADGKLYIGDEDGDLAVLKTGTKKELLHETSLNSAIYTTPAAHDGTLFVVTDKQLIAVAEQKPEKKEASDK